MCGGALVPKSETLPTQEEVDVLSPPLCLDKLTVYMFEDMVEIAVRYFTEVKKRLDRGESVEELLGQRYKISYDTHKKWHEDRYVAAALSASFGSLIFPMSQRTAVPISQVSLILQTL